RLPLPGAALQVAVEAPWNAGLGASAIAFRQLHRKPRPARELGPRRAPEPADQPRTPQGDDRAVAARAGNADAVSRTGVARLDSVPVLRRSQPGASSAGA